MALDIKGRAIFVASALALLLIGSFAAGTAFATPGSGVSQTPVASGVLIEPINLMFKHGDGSGHALDASDIAIVQNTIQPGGYFGWHQHSGPSLIVMTKGTLTFYDADDPTCTGHPVSAGSAYFDPGDHTHNARNETNEPVENYVVRMLPAGGAPRIDMPDPGVCPFGVPSPVAAGSAGGGDGGSASGSGVGMPRTGEGQSTVAFVALSTIGLVVAAAGMALRRAIKSKAG
jgi:quercetin dioxygenase-like cupin family protein